MASLTRILWIYLGVLTGIGAIDDQVSYYETLHHRDFKHHHHVVRRDAGEVRESTVEFEGFGRTFELHLRPRRGLFAHGFRAIRVGQHESSEFEIDRSRFLEGWVEGEKDSSKVLAHYEGDALMAFIRTSEDTYVVEPSWRHLGKSVEVSMIMYKKSDLRNQTQQDEHAAFCGFVQPDGKDEAAYNRQSDDNELFITDTGEDLRRKRSTHSRKKRAASTPNKSACTVALVADYKFFTEVGASDMTVTTSYLITEMASVSDIYENQNFDDVYIGLKFEIKSILVHDGYSTSPSGTHYNQAGISWDTHALLEAFSYNNWGGSCLAHLWTATSFSDGVLGLGWIASSTPGAAGGICSGNSGGYYYNTAWSSALNKYGNRVLSAQATIVTTHEFGHNWGSQHDPSSNECAPGSSNDGNYIMYTYSVSGYNPNNEIFSPCSQRSMVSVLQNKLSSCFSVPSDSFCGNSKVESPDEECDAGVAGEDSCCNSNCQFKSGAVCSDVNSECCDSCQFASTSLKCRSGSNITCDADTYCDGSGPDCPDNSFLPDGSDCIDNGQCNSGQCESFCEWHGYQTCICAEEQYSCKFCCQNTTGAECKPYGFYEGVAFTDLPDGRTCTSGYCDAGSCITQILSGSARLWSIVSNLSLNAIIEFIKKNIVMSIAVLSLFVYVPICCIIACVDWRRGKKEKVEREWHNSENDTLYDDASAKNIRKTYMRKKEPPTDYNRNGQRASSGLSSRGIHVAPL